MHKHSVGLRLVKNNNIDPKPFPSVGPVRMERRVIHSQLLKEHGKRNRQPLWAPEEATVLASTLSKQRVPAYEHGSM